jgi:predicted nuclease of predicted toxin-antitoxin system
MKLLFDQNLSFRLCQDVADIFPGSSHVRTLRLDEADDRAIWDYTKANGFTIVSLDADFAGCASAISRRPRLRCFCAEVPT